MGELAVGVVDLAGFLGDRQDSSTSAGVSACRAMPPGARSSSVPISQPPPMDLVIGDTEQRARPGVRRAAGDRVVDELEDPLVRVAGDPRGQRTSQTSLLSPQQRKLDRPGP